MSARPSQASIAFQNILQHYYECKASAGSVGRGSGIYTSLSRSVGNTSGKVKVSASDLVADVELAANRALRDFPAEKKLFDRVYLQADEAFRTVFQSKLNKDTFDSLINEIETRVGQEFISAGIFPIKEYAATKDVR